MAIGDVDGDGKPDLVVATGYYDGGNTVSVYRNTSTAGAIDSSSFAAGVDFTTDYGPAGVKIADVDGDGKLDLLVANSPKGTISILRNMSAPGTIDSSSFAAKVEFTTSPQYAFTMAVGDLDGDGRPDIVVRNVHTGFGGAVTRLLVFRNTSRSGVIDSSSFAAQVDLAIGFGFGGVAIGDMDGDGKPDLVFPHDNVMTVSRNTSAAGVIDASSFAPGMDFIAGTSDDVIVGDVDGDAMLDIVFTNHYPINICVLRNTSSSGVIDASSFAAKVSIPAGATGTTVHGLAMGDMDGDGKPDLVVTREYYGQYRISIFRNTSTLGIIDTSAFTAKVDIAGFSPDGMAIGDLDGDGKPDLAVTKYPSTVLVFRNRTLEAPGDPLATRSLPDAYTPETTLDVMVAIGFAANPETNGYIVSETLPAGVSFVQVVSGGNSTQVFPQGNVVKISFPADPSPRVVVYRVSVAGHVTGSLTFAGQVSYTVGVSGSATEDVAGDTAVSPNVAATAALTMAVTGDGTATPAVGHHTVNLNQPQSIAAQAAADWHFVNWTTVEGATVANPTAAATTATLAADGRVTANFALTDSDGDGLPDSWEQQIVDASSTDAIATIADVDPRYDFDGDGASNALEFAQGTDPTDPADKASAFDVDNNGSVDALTDGMLVLRYTFGVRGVALIAGVIGPGCKRCDAAAIETYLGAMAP